MLYPPQGYPLLFEQSAIDTGRLHAGPFLGAAEEVRPCFVDFYPAGLP